MFPAAFKEGESKWLLRSGQRGKPRMRLFCFPSAGFGAAMFRLWPPLLPEQFELLAVQPPGRGNRLTEPPLDRFQRLCNAILPEILPLTDRPYAFFGHSMGAVFASQLAIALQSAGARTPIHLFLSSRQPPDSPSPVAPLSHLDDDSFLNELDRRYGAIPKEIRAAPDVLALLLPALRADIAALEAIEGATCKALPAPVTALGGAEDHLVSEAALTAWRNWAPRGFHSRIFPGGHFYLEACRAIVINEVVEVLNQALNRLEASGNH